MTNLNRFQKIISFLSICLLLGAVAPTQTDAQQRQKNLEKVEKWVEFDAKFEQLTEAQQTRMKEKLQRIREDGAGLESVRLIEQYKTQKQSIKRNFDKRDLSELGKELLKEDLKNQRQLLKDINKQIKRDFDSKISRSFTPAEASLLNNVTPNVLYEFQDMFSTNDPQFSSQWGLQSIGAEYLEPGLSSTGSPIIVAMIDSGVDFGHEDLSASKWTSTTCVDESNNPITGGCQDGGYDFIDDDTDPYPTDGYSHGSSVAGIIGAQTDNNTGIASIGNNSVEIMALRACCNANGFFESDAIADAIYFAVNNGAQIINMSLGGPTTSAQLENALAYAESNDVLVIVAAGNYSSNNDTSPFYPANLNQIYNNIISVASTTSWDHLAYFSNYGATTVDIAEPGQDVRSTGKSDYYLTVSGTSFSTPFVTSVASQLRRNSTSTASQVKTSILDTVKTFTSLGGKVKNSKVLQFVTPYTTPVCGDGIVSGEETCDDSNAVSDDGCSATCEIESTSSNPICGNNILEVGEQCDDGNTVSDDGCSATCQTESTTPSETCGNSIIEGSEQCDDGNTLDNDGCSATCTTESTPAGPACGDGTLDEGEQCDDGNLSNGDGCNAICETEETSGGITPESIIPVATGMNGSLIFHHEDHLNGGNVDTDSLGAIISLIDYYPFGDTRVEENSGDYENDYKFTGKEKDEDTGLYYYEARYYDSAIGRFTAVDPWSGELTDPQTLNKYAYVTNNPLKYVDPSGEEPVKAEAVSYEDVLGIINRIELNTKSSGNADVISSVANYYRETNSKTRYIYTEKKGWLDSKHFFTAAEKSNEFGGALTKLLGYGVELQQLWKGDESAFSYEDLTSNDSGVDFKSSMDENKNTSVGASFSSYMKRLGATNPESAPNYSELPDEYSKDNDAKSSMSSRNNTKDNEKKKKKSNNKK